MSSFIQTGLNGRKYCGGPKPDVFARITPDVLSWIHLMIQRKVPNGTGEICVNPNLKNGLLKFFKEFL